MIKQIIKMLWFQKRSNGWIFIELLLVFGALVTILDALLVDAYTYFSPLGYNIENTYQLKLAKLNNKAPGYVPDSLVSLSETEALLKLPYEFSPLPQEGELLAGCNREGEPIVDGKVLRAQRSDNKTHVLWLAVPKEQVDEVRFVRRKEAKA